VAKVLARDAIKAVLIDRGFYTLEVDAEFVADAIVSGLREAGFAILLTDRYLIEREGL
jgi:hypothetical protein